ncbi:amino acid ABC transporter substrate-binding protein [Pseudothauera nasutitermitis]|uniref:Amino acid ABC transporter substrate-binding protein n=1 Tax=Pseudothauera nasutitermitis TaxID=2565930 RepID=A0A4S4B175_9RHOO|nr:transporter substrate-binding domain-containing protein [Pseudothauera nasutitermitis]THF66302.1 amino acid ABC transporter substrate-binding protein [Pseudothauera nasutitermitis]
MLRRWMGALALSGALAVQAFAGDELRVVLTPRSVPFSLLTESGEMVGFNVDMARAVCAEIGRTCKLEVLPFPEIVPAVAAGRYDLGVANFLRTPERERQVAFTVPYWRSTSVFVGRQGIRVEPLASLLADTTVCAIDGSAQWSYLLARAGASAETVRALPSNQDVLDGLGSGACPAALLPTMQVLPFMQGERGHGLAFLGAPLGEAGLGGPVHMIVRPDAPELRAAVDRALRRLIANGEHERAARHYFPFSIL